MRAALTLIAAFLAAATASAGAELELRHVARWSPAALELWLAVQPRLAVQATRLRGGAIPPSVALPTIVTRESEPLAERQVTLFSRSSGGSDSRSPHSSTSELRHSLECAEQRAGAAAAANTPREKAVAAPPPPPNAANAAQLLRGRVITVVCLYMSTLINGMMRRTLGSAAPSLVSEGIMTHEELQEAYLLGYRAFALGKVLAAPLLVLLGNKPTLLLQLAALVMSTLCFASPNTSARTKVWSWAAARVFTATASASGIPFVRNWFPRDAYGRVWALMSSGLQTGGLVSSLFYQRPLLKQQLHWRRPFYTTAALGLVPLFACALILREAPPPGCSADGAELAPPPPAQRTPSAAEPNATLAAAPSPRLELRLMLRKFCSRWQFWLMLVARGSSEPIMQYGFFVSSYFHSLIDRDAEQAGALARWTAPAPAPTSTERGVLSSILPRLIMGGLATDGVGGVGGADAAWPAQPTRRHRHCVENPECEGHYRTYQLGYVIALLLGSIAYDRSTQLDKALMVAGMSALNIVCWGALALGEPGSVDRDGRIEGRLGRAFMRLLRPSWTLPLRSSAKTAIAAFAAATISIPSSLPFAMFAMDFGKEGAAVLSALLSAVGFGATLVFLRAFPHMLHARSFREVHALLGTLGALSFFSLSAIMFADQRKFARGYIIRSSLFNESVVSLHACGHPGCAEQPMWNPGTRRLWKATAHRSMFNFQPHAPNRRCHNCGRASVLDCKVGEAFARRALIAPFEKALALGWVRDQTPLRKAPGGWDFSDPFRYPIADDSELNFGDEAAYQKYSDKYNERMESERLLEEREALDATKEAEEQPVEQEGLGEWATITS